MAAAQSVPHLQQHGGKEGDGVAVSVHLTSPLREVQASSVPHTLQIDDLVWQQCVPVCVCICICIVFDQAGVTRAFLDGLQAEIILESALQRCGHNFTCLQFYIPLELSRHTRNYTHRVLKITRVQPSFMYYLDLLVLCEV
jgi:hypothetical protein